MIGCWAFLGIIVAHSAFAAIEGPSSMVRGTDPEDSLQILVQQDPDNSSHWVGLGQLALKTGQDDLAKGYFDEAIKLSKSAADPILRIGVAWLEAGKVLTCLPYLLPNLAHLETVQLTRLAKSLEAKHPLAAVLVLRHHASRDKLFTPELRRAGELSFRAGQYEMCRDILGPQAENLDSNSVKLLLLSGFYSGKTIASDAIFKSLSRSNSPETKTLAAINLSMLGEFKNARVLSEGPGSTTPAPIRSFIQAQELAASDKAEEATKLFEEAQNSSWSEFRIVAIAELYRHFSQTGNGFKAEQLWEGLKDKDTLPQQKEFMARHFLMRNYEKQARILFKNVYRSTPGRATVLKVLWDELIDGDLDGLGQQLNILLAADPIHCDANQLAMRYYLERKQNKEVVHHGRNVVLYCYEVVEPYFDLATALINLSKPDEARTYFGKYVKSGGDRKRIPSYMR